MHRTPHGFGNAEHEGTLIPRRCVKLSVDVNDIVQAEVIPWDKSQYGIGYVTKDGKQAADLIGVEV
jgi:hypothetical protein